MVPSLEQADLPHCYHAACQHEGEYDREHEENSKEHGDSMMESIKKTKRENIKRA